MCWYVGSTVRERQWSTLVNWKYTYFPLSSCRKLLFERIKLHRRVTRGHDITTDFNREVCIGNSFRKRDIGFSPGAKRVGIVLLANVHECARQMCAYTPRCKQFHIAPFPLKSFGGQRLSSISLENSLVTSERTVVEGAWARGLEWVLQLPNTLSPMGESGTHGNKKNAGNAWNA